MAKHASLLILAGLLAVGALACNFQAGGRDSGPVKGSGQVTEEPRTISKVSAVDLTGIGTLTIELGDTEELVIEAEDNLLPYITTRVRGGTLEIGTRSQITLQPTKPVRYRLTVISLEGLQVSGLGDIKGPALSAERFDINISGGGDIQLAGVEAEKLQVTLSGLGNLGIDGGTVDSQTIDISGSGGYEGRDLASRIADVTISGLGSTTIRVSEQLDATISGSGTVTYAGGAVVHADISGLGAVNRLNE